MRRLAFGTGRLWLGLLLWLGLYWVWAIFLPASLVGGIVNSLVQAMALGVVVAYFRGAAEAVQRPISELTSGVALLLAITGLALFTHLKGDYGSLYYAIGQPAWMRNNLLSHWLSWGLALFLAFHLLVKNSEHGIMPNENLRVTGIWVAVGAFIVALIFIIGGTFE